MKCNQRWRNRLATGSVLFSLALTPVAFANQPVPPAVGIQSEMEGRVLLVRLENREKQKVVLNLFPGELSTLVFEKSQVKLAPGEKSEVKLAIREVKAGIQVLQVSSLLEFDDQRTGAVAGPSFYQVFRTDGQTARKVSYEEAFLRQREKIEGVSEVAKIDLGGAVYASAMNPLAFKAGAQPAGVQIEPIERRDIRELAKMVLKQLPKDNALGEGRSRGNLEAFDFLEEEPQNFSAEDSERSIFGVTVKGHMSLKTSANSYKSAWGWVVRAWQKVGNNWKFLGWTYVKGDGSWEIALSNPATGVPVRIEYQTKNRFVSLQDSAGNPYTWGDNWTLTGGSTDIGYRFADLSLNGNLPGVDKLYVGATNIWVKFFNTGMNALRDQPIEVTFPNTLASGKCIQNGSSGKYAWSCSYWGDGRIYIIPEHAVDTVVQHEIAHSINSFYWNGNMPAGSGGQHNLWNCYNNGLALTEGFANFISYWTQFDRTQASPTAAYIGMNIESIPAGVCSNQTAEMRVASAFWDLYDVPNDSLSSTEADALYYINQAVPVAIFLNNPKSAMSEYLPVVQAGQSAAWQAEFKRLFKLNKIVN